MIKLIAGTAVAVAVAASAQAMTPPPIPSPDIVITQVVHAPPFAAPL